MVSSQKKERSSPSPPSGSERKFYRIPESYDDENLDADGTDPSPSGRFTANSGRYPLSLLESVVPSNIVQIVGTIDDDDGEDNTDDGSAITQVRSNTTSVGNNNEYDSSDVAHV